MKRAKPSPVTGRIAEILRDAGGQWVRTRELWRMASLPRPQSLDRPLRTLEGDGLIQRSHGAARWAGPQRPGLAYAQPWTLRDRILVLLDETGGLKPAGLFQQLRAHGFARSSIYSELTDLRHEGIVRTLNPGIWILAY